ncbi:MAG: heavy metal-responsive transcriptional regulator [Candidatus Eisenbacteria bacterium]|uniref:Heavy metal-responsive transcriptional regulator n=1 Tax=Eiseniibacteriota bacterium TaxID=2212470 RepID=A0A7Y2E6F7_UNCEI|nr:heavy metal-responsive transcriptional regulator [Candidatus Eisenbacteria bacterium]
MNSMTIGQLAKQTKIGLETIRFYERVGLIKSPPRRSSGYRAYPPETVRRVRFIRTAKELGFSLQEIGELLSLRVDPVESCGHVKTIAEHKILDMEQRIKTLQRMRRSLRRLVTACDAREATSDCPILDSLDTEARR